MKLGVLTAAFGNPPFEQMLDTVTALGLQVLMSSPAQAQTLSSYALDS